MPYAITRGLLAAFSAIVLSASWPDIPKETWAIKGGDIKGHPGALILVDRYHFHRRQLDRFRRVLVLSESGKAIPELTLLGDRILRLEGRTLFPDLREQTFAQGQDVIKTTVVKTHRDTLQATKVIPPGVTNHCIVDVKWVEPILENEAPVPEGSGWHYAFSLAAPVPVQLAEIIVDKDVADFGWVRNYFPGHGREEPETQDAKEVRKIFRDIPARPTAVLASEGELALPSCHWYWSPQALIRRWLGELNLQRGRLLSMGDAITITILYQWLLEGPEGRPGRGSSLWDLGKDIEPTDPHGMATALLRRLREKVKTVAEVGERPSSKELERQGLDTALKRGWGTYNQLWRLAFHLLREQGLQTNVVLALDRQESLMGDFNNPWQYDQILLAVDDGKGNLLYLNPGSTFQPIGLPPWLQGGESMMVIPSKKRLDWASKLLTLPVEKAEVNGERWTITLQPGEESDTYRGGAHFTGSRSPHWKARIKNQVSGDFKKSLGPFVEHRGFKLSHAAGEHLASPWVPLNLTLVGNRENEGGRRRVLQPFPFLTPPFEIPTSWPEKRDVSIQFPMNSVVDAECRIPWKGTPPAAGDIQALERSNSLGKASWRATLEDRGGEKDLVVRLRLDVTYASASAYRYSELKALASWFQEALSRTVPAPTLN